MDDNRLVDIETKLAHQEHTLGQLNDALTSQQAQIMQLKSLCETLVQRINAMAEPAAGGDPLDERPPHY